MGFRLMVGPVTARTLMVAKFPNQTLLDEPRGIVKRHKATEASSRPPVATEAVDEFVVSVVEFLREEHSDLAADIVANHL